MARTFSFDSLGVWPKDLAGQREWMNRLRAMLDQLNDYVDETAGYIVVLEQATEPTQSEWEAAYTAQSGLSLPIPATADLVWWSTVSSRIAGHYRTVEGDTTIYRKEHLYPRGSTVFLESESVTTARNVNYYLGENPSHYPSITAVMPTAGHIIITATISVVLSSGSGFFGVDFLLDGVKVGNTYFGVASDQGLVNVSTTELIHFEIVLPDMAAGSYEIQMLGGIVGSPASPPTYAIGGVSGASANGIGLMTVRGVAQQ